MDIEHLRTLEAAATPGPWREVAESGEWWIEHYSDDKPEGVFVCDSNSSNWRLQADIDFVVAARNAMPALLAELTQLRALAAVVQAHRTAIETCGGIWDSERAVFEKIEEWEKAHAAKSDY